MPEPLKGTKRPRLPGASELFRPTTGAKTSEPAPANEPTPDKAATGRVRHDEKITVYFSSEELMRLEDARLNLRREHRLSVDRGRIVRAAVALALADLEENGTSGAVFTSLSQ